MLWARIITLVVAFHLSVASSGDRAPEFIECVSTCTDLDCSQPFPISLRLTRWSCLDDCRYACMHQITDRDTQLGVRTQQYFGKWPFWRFSGMQEPASVLFSLLNFWAHAKGALQIRKKLSDSHPMKSYYLTWAVTSMNAWIWSSIFHTRDLPMTEKLDYFSAALAILYALYYTTIRLFHLYTSPQDNRCDSHRTLKHISQKVLAILFIFLYVAHVSYLTMLPRFDYTYNMIFNLALGLLHNVLWLIYALPSSMSIFQRFPARSRTYRPRFATKAAIIVIVTMAATSLEVLDFPPWVRVIDAHALWHLATAPLAVYWYKFLLNDALDASWREHKS